MLSESRLVPAAPCFPFFVAPPHNLRTRRILDSGATAASGDPLETLLPAAIEGGSIYSYSVKVPLAGALMSCGEGI